MTQKVSMFLGSSHGEHIVCWYVHSATALTEVHKPQKINNFVMHVNIFKLF